MTRPRVMSVDQEMGTDPDINQRVRYYLQRFPHAPRGEIAAELELNEWLVGRALGRLRGD